MPTHLTRWVDAYADHDSVRKDPLLRYLHPEKGLELTGRAHRAGVKILAGTDYIVAGADLHRELQQLVRAGLIPPEALKTATVNPAEYFGLRDDVCKLTWPFLRNPASY